MTDPVLAYTRVHDSSILGRVILDPSMPADEIHLYRVKGDTVITDSVINIGGSEEKKLQDKQDT